MTRKHLYCKWEFCSRPVLYSQLKRSRRNCFKFHVWKHSQILWHRDKSSASLDQPLQAFFSLPKYFLLVSPGLSLFKDNTLLKSSLSSIAFGNFSRSEFFNSSSCFCEAGGGEGEKLHSLDERMCWEEQLGFYWKGKQKLSAEIPPDLQELISLAL